MTALDTKTDRRSALTKTAAVSSTAPAAATSARRRKPLALLGLRGFKGMVKTEAKVWSRDYSTPFFALIFPALLVVAITAMNPTMRDPITSPEMAGTIWYGVTPLTMFMPPVLAMAIATPSLTIMPATFGGFREKGVLRRFSATPMRPQGLIGAHYVINLAATLAGSILALVVGQVMFGFAAPANAAIVALAFVLGMAAVFALGALIAAVVPRGSTGSAIGTAVYFPMLILAGVWTAGSAGMPEVLVNIGRFTPVGAASQAMQAGWFGTGFPLAEVLVMVAWTAVLVPLSSRLFRWS
jgi:ABC-2 type transport system permease protein